VSIDRRRQPLIDLGAQQCPELGVDGAEQRGNPGRIALLVRGEPLGPAIDAAT
jgi:hypothetical protein